MSDDMVTTERGLGASASRGAMFTMGGQSVRIVIQLLSVVVLARLLDPSDYGLIAMTTAIIGVGEVFRDFGLSSAAIQAKTLSREERDNLFWLNSAIGVVLALTVIACSGLIASFYHEPRVQPLAEVLSLTFVFNGLGTQYRASLTRDMRLWQLSTAEVAGQAAGLAVAILVALAGGGFWALAALQVLQAAVTFFVNVMHCRWFPRRYQRGVPVRGMVRFGGYLVLAQLVTYFSRNIDSVVIGARFGVSPLGIYSRAFQLMTLPLNQINAPSSRVALPTLAKLQSQPNRYSAFLMTGQTVMLHVVAAAFAFAAGDAHALIFIVLGNRWAQVVPLFQIFAVAGVFQAASYAVYWIFLSQGRTRSQLLSTLATRPLVIALILVGSQWGITGVAIGYSLGTILSWPVGFLWIRGLPGVHALTLFLNGLRAAASYGICGALSYFTTSILLPSADPWLQLAAGAVAFGVGAVALFFLWPAFRADLRRIRSAIALVKSPKRSR